MESGFFTAEDGFDLRIAGLTVLRHRLSCPAVSVARGNSDVTMRHGNFQIIDTPFDRVDGGAWSIAGSVVTLAGVAKLTFNSSVMTLMVTELADTADRIWLRLHAEPRVTLSGGAHANTLLVPA